MKTMIIAKSRSIRLISAWAMAIASLAGISNAWAAEKSPVKPYKLDKCIVSDEKLGEMGKPFVIEYKGQEIKLCCKSCKKDFDKDPAKFLKKMEKADKEAEKAKP